MTKTRFDVVAVRRLAILLTILGVGSAADAVACDTPVYRYAMYRWQPAPYEVYFLHDEPPSEELKKLHAAIDGMAEATQPANLALIPVDLSVDGQLKRIPPPLRAAWEARSEGVHALHVLVAPHGAVLHSGLLGRDDIDAIVDSPARRRVAELLGKGAAGVLMMLDADLPADADDDLKKKVEAANRGAEESLKSLAAGVREGRYTLYRAPTSPGGPGGEAAAEKTDQKAEIGVIRLSRKAAQEDWLVRTLLAVEDDLRDEEFVTQPMVFPIYGRGRALPPYIGAGVTEDNLLDCLEFITGACSCTVKEQNPGVDLPFRQDWEETAAKLAEIYGSEEGNESILGAADLFPELIIPETSDVTADSDDTSAEPSEDSPADPTDSDAVAKDEADAADDEAGSDSDQGDDADAAVEVASAEAGPGTSEEPEAVGRQMMWTMGLGLFVALGVLFAATFLVLRPR